MTAKQFELGMYCLGNGTTVCNKAVMERGDYKQIAHISSGGNIKLYVSSGYIPAEDMQRIQVYVAAQADEFRRSFEARDVYSQYRMILDSAPIADFLKITSDKRPLMEKLPELREAYYRRS